MGFRRGGMGIIDNIEWEVKKPPYTIDDVWLKELQEMRGKALYQKGLRPFFKIADNIYNDCDGFDSISYHILAKYNKQIVGCVRILILDQTLNCVSAKIVNAHTSFSSIINELFADKKLAEISRLVISSNFSSLTLHFSLMAASVLLTLKFNALVILNAAKAASYYSRNAGAQLFPRHAGPYKSDMYNADINLFFLDQNKFSNKFISEIKRMETLLEKEIISKNI